MLLERAAGLSARIARYNQLKGTAEEAAMFETRATQFGNVAEKLERVRDGLGRFAQASIEVAFVPADGSVLAERAQRLRTAVREDPQQIAEPPFNLKYEFTDRLLAIHGAAERTMLEAWRAHVRAVADSHSDDVLAALAALPQFRQSIAKIRQCRAEIVALSNIIPPDPQTSVARLKALVEEQRSAWSAMTADGIPGPVIGFLKACANEGAPLSGLTAEVREWLETRNLLGAFRIHIR